MTADWVALEDEAETDESGEDVTDHEEEGNAFIETEIFELF